MSRRSFAALCAVLVAGCDAFPFATIDDFVGDGSADQGASEASADADAAMDAGVEAEASCPVGLISPLQIVNGSATSLTGTHICNPQSASAKDGQFAELEETVDESVTVLGSSVNTCIAATFPGELATAVITVKAENTACTTACFDGGCNTGHSLVILGGPSTDLLAATFIANPSINTTVADKPVAFSTSVSVVFVCRNGTQPSRDIPAVDAILGTCK